MSACHIVLHCNPEQSFLFLSYPAIMVRGKGDETGAQRDRDELNIQQQLDKNTSRSLCQDRWHKRVR